MARILGGIIGLAITGALVAISAVTLGIAGFGSVLSSIVGFLGLSSGAWLAVFAFTIFVLTFFAYIIGVVAQLPVLAAPATTAALPLVPVESFMSGLITGLSAGVNFGVWALVLSVLGIVVGGILGLICMLSLVAALSRNPTFQTVLGWASWLMPMSWLATAIGLLLFVVNLPFALAAFGTAAVRLDVTTGTIETTGGITAMTGFVGGGFDLGNFTFLSPGTAGLAFQTPFTATGVSAHETGHVLAVASLGGVFHWINAIDENIPPLARGTSAYGELVAESHFPRTLPIRHVRIWS